MLSPDLMITGSIEQVCALLRVTTCSERSFVWPYGLEVKRSQFAGNTQFAFEVRVSDRLVYVASSKRLNNYISLNPGIKNRNLTLKWFIESKFNWVTEIL